jgi:phage-related minor tail protein
MANRIKGITIELNGDATGLQDALKGVNGSLDNTQKALSDVTKLLKLDPKNTALVEQKQKLLADAVEQTREKLDALESAQEQVQQAFDKGELGEDKYLAFQRELEATRGQLGKYETDLASLETEQERLGSNTQRLEKLFAATGQSVNDYADVLGSRLTSAIKGGYASADQLQSAFDKVAKSAANSKEELQALVEAVDDVDSAAKKIKGETLMQVAELSDALQNTMGQAAATVGKSFAGVTAGAAAAATATTGLLARLGDGFNKAVNQIGASTGATGKDLKQLGQIAQNVYSHNFGDGLEDVADGISVVRQTTQLMGKELQVATEAGFALRDTFGYDLAESARTASSLMKNFQIDAEKAYNIIAVGAQNGADQNGDLLDTLNEYSAQYAALGLSADQFVNGLISGAKAGVFSIDKVGDAVKEFNIRAKDGSKSTTGAFATLKLNAAKTMQAFASGGDTAQRAFFQVVRALESMQDPVAKNQTAVALFGTQYEDLEQTVLPVLASMEDSSKQAYDALGQINQVKYDDLGSAMEGLKRTIEGALLPSASKITSGPLMDAMEALQDMAQKLAKNIKAGKYDSFFAGIADGINGVVKMLPKIGDGVQKLAPVVSKVAGGAVDFLGAAVDNIDLVVAAIAGIGTAVAALKLLTFIGDVTQAVKTLTAAFSLSAGPIGLAVVAIGALAAVITDVAISGDSASDILRDNTEATQKLREESEKLTEECERNREERQKNADAAETETATAEEYAKKLSDLAGKENKSASEKKKMAKYVEKLNDLVPNLSLKYDEEKDQLNKSTDAIYRNIDALKEQARVKAYTENYEAAVKEQAEVEKKLNDARVQYHKNLEELDRTQRKLNAVSPADQPALYDNLSAKVNIAKKNVEESKKAFDDLSDSFRQSSSDMDYWGEKMEEETDAQAVVDNLNKLADVAEEAGIKLPKSVSDGVKSGKYQMAESVDELKRLIDFDAAIQKAGLQGVEIPQVLSAGVNSGQVSVTDAIQRLNGIAKFDGLAKNAGLSGDKAIQNLRDNIASGAVSVSAATNRVAAVAKFDKLVKNGGLSGTKTVQTLRNSILNGETTLAAAAKQIADRCDNNLAPKRTKTTGETASKEYAGGLQKGAAIAERAARSVGSGSMDELRTASSKGSGVGYSLSEGFASGILRGEWKAINASIKLVDDAIAAARKRADVNSPSKKMRDMVGAPIAEGLAVGIQEGSGDASDAAAQLVDDALTAADAAFQRSRVSLMPLTTAGAWTPASGTVSSSAMVSGTTGSVVTQPIEKLNLMLTSMADSIVSGVSTLLRASSVGAGGDVHLDVYLYPSGPKMGEQIVSTYDTYKRRLGG